MSFEGDGPLHLQVQAKQHGEGMVESAKGNVRETIGNVTGDKSQQAKGESILQKTQHWFLCPASPASSG